MDYCAVNRQYKPAAQASEFSSIQRIHSLAIRAWLTAPECFTAFGRGRQTSSIEIHVELPPTAPTHGRIRNASWPPAFGPLRLPSVQPEM